MVDLVATSPCAGLLPLRIGRQLAEEVDLGVLTLVTAMKGRAKSLQVAMQSAHGIVPPGPGHSTGRAGNRAIWFGRGQVLLAGPEPGEGLRDVSCLTDQSDAWACVALEGPRAEDVLARLVPVDMRVSAFPLGATARTQIGHMNGSVTRLGETRFLLMVFRSVAATLVHDLDGAMQSVAAQG